MPSVQAAPRLATLKPALDAQLEQFARHVRLGTRAAATLKMQQGHVSWLLEKFGDVPLVELRARLLDDVAMTAIDAGVSPKTVQKKFSTLRQACALAVRHEELERMPQFPVWEFPPVGPPKHRWCESWAEVERIRAALPPERAAWLALCVWTGQHAADVERMVWSDVRLEAGELWLRNTKNRKPGLWVKCPRPLLTILRARHAQLRPASDARIVKPWPTRFYQLGRACLRLGLAPITATGLRHTGATFVAAELGITVAGMRWFGWSSYAMMEQVYAHALPAQLADVARVLSGPRRPPQAKQVRAVRGKTAKGRKAA
jgi:integrase